MLALTLENSTAAGVVAIGRDDTLLGTETIPPRKRHNVDLMAAVAALCQTHRVQPADLDAVFVSLGPGSFTGLRVAVATAKSLALTLGVKVVGVPTIDILRAQHPDAVVALNIKRDTAWSAGPGLDPDLRSLDELRALGRPLVADKLDGATPPRPDVAVLHRLGRQRLLAGQTDDPFTLAPAYIREPEAVTLWEARENTG